MKRYARRVRSRAALSRRPSVLVLVARSDCNQRRHIMSEKSTLLPTQPVHNVNETTTSQKVAAGLALFCAGTTVGLAWRYVQ